tara:strand:- start:207 stop:443 length:237 start_codon:yes stop_codon:yes gene_type:complete
MNYLKELIGQTVTARMFDAKTEKGTDIRCTVINITIQDFYFQENNESIYVTVSVQPIGKIPKGSDFDFNDVNLSDIRK